MCTCASPMLFLTFLLEVSIGVVNNYRLFILDHFDRSYLFSLKREL